MTKEYQVSLPVPEVIAGDEIIVLGDSDDDPTWAHVKEINNVGIGLHFVTVSFVVDSRQNLIVRKRA